MKEEKKRYLKPFVDEFYKNNCRAKVEYQGMYAFPGTEPGQIIWTAWSGEEYVEALLKQLETGIAQKILVCLADGNCLKILQALIHKTLAQQSVSVADLAAVSGTVFEEVTDCLQRMEALELVTKKSLDNECAYSAKQSLAEGFVMMLAGLHAMRQPPVLGDADAPLPLPSESKNIYRGEIPCIYLCLQNTASPLQRMLVSMLIPGTMAEVPVGVNESVEELLFMLAR